MTSVPDGFAAASIAAAFAALGFVSKQIFEWILSLKSERRSRHARLATLLSLLNGTAAVFRVQIELRDRLFQSVTARDPERLKDAGFEAAFTAAFPTMTSDERELHAVIRGYTINGLKPLNEALWLSGSRRTPNSAGAPSPG